MSLKRRSCMLLACAMIFSVLVAPEVEAKEETITKIAEMRALFIDYGTIRNQIGLDTTIKLNKDNGKYVNLYVENKGSSSVIATINDQSSRTFKKGESGHIYVEVTQGALGGDKSYNFKVVAGTNGGMVDIYYKIAQRDSMILTSDPGIMPVTSETPVEKESISEDGITWYQKKGYTAYRIWVQNDTNREMKVTVTYTGMPAGMSRVFRVQAGKSKSMEVNKARAGVQYYADFQTDDGSFEGICSVRISDTPFN